MNLLSMKTSRSQFSLQMAITKQVYHGVLQLSTNIDLARKRLQGLPKILHKHLEVQQEYHATIQEQLGLDFIEKCSDQPIQNCDDMMHYLPHYAVIHTY